MFLEGLQQSLDGNTAISHAPKPSKCMLRELKLGPTAQCTASVNHPVALRCRMSLIGVIARVLLCSWVYQHVSLCPKLNRFWLAGEPAWSSLRKGRKARPLARLPRHAATQTRTVLWTVGGWVGLKRGWGWVSLHYPFPSFSIQLKVLDDPDTTEFWCSRRLSLLLFCVSFIYSSLYFLSTHRLQVHFTGLCWSHHPALLPSSLQFSSCGSLVPHLGNINMAARQ